MCYLVRIPKIEDGTIFQFVKKNFKVESPPEIPFESKAPTPVARVDPPSVPGEGVNPNRIADRNVQPNIDGYVDHDSL
jgi:hypothetical protein